MSQKAIPTTLLLLALSLWLQGCGFQLRGSSPLDNRISPVYIQGPGLYDQLRIELTQLIESSEIQVVESKEQAETLLRIRRPMHDRRVLSVDANGKVAEYELHEGADFDLVAQDGSELISSQSVSVLQSYINSEEQVLGKQQEEALLRRDMKRDLAGQIIRRIQAGLN